MSHEEQAGESTTASPSAASEAASLTASAIEPARWTGATPSTAAAIFSAASPITTTARAWLRPSTSRSGAYEPPLSRPPAMRTKGRGKPSTEATTAATLVPFESS